MASSQCYKPVEHPCNQGQQNHSLGQKVSELANRAFKREETHNGQITAKCQTHCHSEKQAECGVVKTGTHCSSQTHSHGSTNGMTPAPACNTNSNRRGERKKGLFQRIKDGISGHSDGSSSESDSDDEKCGKRKN